MLLNHHLKGTDKMKCLTSLFICIGVLTSTNCLSIQAVQVPGLCILPGPNISIEKYLSRTPWSLKWSTIERVHVYIIFTAHMPQFKVLI